MSITKRTVVRLVSFAIAVIGVLAVRNILLMRENVRSQRSITNGYTRAIEDLALSCDNLSATLEKQMYASSGEMHQKLAQKLYTEATSAKTALSRLPMEELPLENTYKFLSQVGNYSLSVAKKLEKGQSLTDDDYSNLIKLYKFSKDLSGDMWSLESSVASGEIPVGTQELGGRSANVNSGFTEFEGEFDSYPKLIYDGPFSDNIMEKKSEMIQKASKVTKQKALARASAALKINSAELTQMHDVDGTMPAWRFANENGTATCEVTKSGGYISYFLKSKNVNKIEITNKTAVRNAENFLKDLGILSMKTTYYEVEENVMIVNFAYSDLGKTVYPDLVKVSVAMDSGDILGYDARGYLNNHKERSYPDSLYSKNKAEGKVSPKLKVNSRGIAVIPKENAEEVLCYEFKCKSETGRNVLVYINAQTGAEEDILILVESASGTLTK